MSSDRGEDNGVRTSLLGELATVVVAERLLVVMIERFPIFDTTSLCVVRTFEPKKDMRTSWKHVAIFRTNSSTKM